MHRCRHAVWLAALLSVVTALLASASIASAQATVQRYPWEIVVRGCDEDVIASGTITSVSQFIFDEAGGGHQHFTVNFNGAGYGVDSGSPYRVTLAAEVTNSQVQGPGLVTNMNGTYTVVGQRGLGVRTGTGAFHITINALGEITSFKDDGANIVCR